MRKSKKFLPLLIGIFMLIGGLTFFSMQNSEADPDPANCYFDNGIQQCSDTFTLNCTCFDVDP